MPLHLRTGSSRSVIGWGRGELSLPPTVYLVLFGSTGGVWRAGPDPIGSIEIVLSQLFPSCSLTSQPPRSGGRHRTEVLSPFRRFWTQPIFAYSFLSLLSLKVTQCFKPSGWLSTELPHLLRVAQSKVHYLSPPSRKYLCPLGSDITPSRTPLMYFNSPVKKKKTPRHLY